MNTFNRYTPIPQSDAQSDDLVRYESDADSDTTIVVDYELDTSKYFMGLNEVFDDAKVAHVYAVNLNPRNAKFIGLRAFQLIAAAYPPETPAYEAAKVFCDRLALWTIRAPDSDVGQLLCNSQAIINGVKGLRSNDVLTDDERADLKFKCEWLNAVIVTHNERTHGRWTDFNATFANDLSPSTNELMSIFVEFGNGSFAVSTLGFVHELILNRSVLDRSNHVVAPFKAIMMFVALLKIAGATDELTSACDLARALTLFGLPSCDRFWHQLDELWDPEHGAFKEWLKPYGWMGSTMTFSVHMSESKIGKFRLGITSTIATALGYPVADGNGVWYLIYVDETASNYILGLPKLDSLHAGSLFKLLTKMGLQPE